MIQKILKKLVSLKTEEQIIEENTKYACFYQNCISTVFLNNRNKQ